MILWVSPGTTMSLCSTTAPTASAAFHKSDKKQQIGNKNHNNNSHIDPHADRVVVHSLTRHHLRCRISQSVTLNKRGYVRRKIVGSQLAQVR